MQKTERFCVDDELDNEMNQTMLKVKTALEEKGYNPIHQVVGYVMSGDPTYITSHKKARDLIQKIDRDVLLETMVKYYLQNLN